MYEANLPALVLGSVCRQRRALCMCEGKCSGTVCI